MSSNAMHPRHVWYIGAVCPGSVSADKGQEPGISLGFDAKLESLQLARTPLWVIYHSRDAGLLIQTWEALAFVTVPVF